MTTSDEVEEDPNEGVLDCHTCYHSLELHRNGVGCGAIADACTVEGCCRHAFPTGLDFRICSKCGERRRDLKRCGHYHVENTICAEGAKLIREAFESSWEDTRDQIHFVPHGTVIGPLSLAKPKRLHLMVTHNNENVTFYPVGDGKPWKVDAGLQLLIIGKGVGRMMVPLCNIMYFTLQEY